MVRSLVTLKVRSDARESTRLYGLQFELIPFSSIDDCCVAFRAVCYGCGDTDLLLLMRY